MIHRMVALNLKNLQAELWTLSRTELALVWGGVESHLEELAHRHCLQKGPYFKDLVLNKDLFGILGPYLYFRVLIFTILVLFMQRMLNHEVNHLS